MKKAPSILQGGAFLLFKALDFKAQPLGLQELGLLKFSGNFHKIDTLILCRASAAFYWQALLKA